MRKVSSSADDDQRHAALDPRHLLKKVDENFSQKSFFDWLDDIGNVLVPIVSYP